jgi:ABC-type multidrug transport system ATPase subunit
MLCDRVAVLVGGKLQGVGAPWEIVSMDIYGMEILFEARPGRPLPQKVIERATHTGDRYRIEVPEADMYTALEELRDGQARILSVAPLRPSLEDYFFKLVAQRKTTANSAEAASHEASR